MFKLDFFTLEEKLPKKAFNRETQCVVWNVQDGEIEIKDIKVEWWPFDEIDQEFQEYKWEVNVPKRHPENVNDVEDIEGGRYSWRPLVYSGEPDNRIEGELLIAWVWNI